MTLISPTRVAQQYLRRVGGILQEPPAMHAAILEWTYAYVASRAIQEKERALEARRLPSERDQALDDLRQSMDALRASPTSWEAYRNVYDKSWIFGHAGNRFSVKDFQKLTPERKDVLVRQVQAFLQRLEERLDGEAVERRRQVAEVERDVTKLRTYLRPGVTYQGDKQVHKEFPVDLTGWRYGQEELERRVRENAKAQAKGVVETFEQTPKLKENMRDVYERFRDQMETGRGYFDAIHVILKTEPIPGAKAYWQPATRQLVVALPPDAKPQDLEGLSKSLRHELQHFSQSYLAAVLGDTSAVPPTGLPSRKIRTPEFEQRMDPHHPSFRADSPDVMRAIQKWKALGLDPRRIDWHSLDDLEFYTNLADSIEQFKSQMSRAGKGDPRVAVKLFAGAIRVPEQRDYRSTEEWYAATEALGGYDFIKWFAPSPFFATLKKHAPPKWQKAVSELTKAVL